MPKGRPWDYAKSDPRYRPKKKDRKKRMAAFHKMLRMRKGA